MGAQPWRGKGPPRRFLLNAPIYLLVTQVLGPQRLCLFMGLEIQEGYLATELYLFSQFLREGR
jgi:hypothetical protein